MKTLTANIRLSFKQILHREIWADNIKLIILPEEKKNEEVPICMHQMSLESVLPCLLFLHLFDYVNYKIYINNFKLKATNL